jgi:hypothetical protein
MIKKGFEMKREYMIEKGFGLFFMSDFKRELEQLDIRERKDIRLHMK